MPEAGVTDAERFESICWHPNKLSNPTPVCVSPMHFHECSAEQRDACNELRPASPLNYAANPFLKTNQRRQTSNQSYAGAPPVTAKPIQISHEQVRIFNAAHQIASAGAWAMPQKPNCRCS